MTEERKLKMGKEENRQKLEEGRMEYDELFT